MFEPEVAKALEDLCNRLAEAHPDAGAVLARLRAGEMDEAEAMKVLMGLVVANPGMAASITELGEKALAPTREGTGLTLHEDMSNLTVQVDDMDVPVLTQTGPGLPNMNPLYEAALAERLQFDEDIPEARTSPLLPGMKPAVPVETNIRNMAAIGHMLETASEEVMMELGAARQEAAAEVEALPDAKLIGAGFHKTGDAIAVTSVSADEYLERIKGKEPEGYRTGHLPARRSVSTPSGGFLASMTPEDKREATWKALSTTQGRRTALGGVTEIIAQGLASEGVELIVKADPSGRLSPEEEVVAYEEWTVTLAGPKATQSQFSFIDNAAKALLAKLVKLDLKGLHPSARLDVLSINTVDVNQVGWAARIVVRA